MKAKIHKKTFFTGNTIAHNIPLSFTRSPEFVPKGRHPVDSNYFSELRLPPIMRWETKLAFLNNRLFLSPVTSLP